MQFIYLNTRSGLIKRVLELQEELSDYKGYYEYYKKEYKMVVKEKADEIKHLQQQLEHEKNAIDGYKKAYNELKEKQTKEVKVTVNQFSNDVWKLIRDEVLQETHKCTKECFREHVLPAIQSDYNSIDPKYKKNENVIDDFLDHWERRLSETYYFVDALFLFQGHVIVNFKK